MTASALQATLALSAATLLGAAVTLLIVRRTEGKRRPYGERGQRRSGKYVAGMIKVKPEMVNQYKQLHDKTWDEVMERMYKSNMRDFVVWLHEETSTMFHQFIYVGDSFEADMEAISNDPVVRYWWTFCESCQAPLHWEGPPPSQGGRGHPNHPHEWWSPMLQVNHCGAWSTAWATAWPDPDFQPTHPQRLTSTKDAPPLVHNRVGDAAAWVSYKQRPFDIGERGYSE